LIDQQDFLITDNNGNTCLHNMAKYYYNKLDHLSEEKENINKILFEKIEFYLNSNKISEELFEIQNNDGDTFLMLNPHLIEIVINSKFNIYKMLNLCNKRGLNIFNIICLDYFQYFEKFINDEKINENFLIEYNQKNIMNINFAI